MAKLFSVILLGIFLGAFFLRSPKTQSHFLASLSQKSEVSWDVHGVPTVHAPSLPDAYLIQGYITARDRFFQMELTRRKMAGTLAELFGAKALTSDITARRWNYVKAAERAFDQMNLERKKLLEAYSEGVNRSLSEEGLPWELKVLRVKPSPWTPRDCFLIVLSMYDSLNRQEEFQEEAVSLIQSRFPQSAAFLTLDWGFLDSSIVPDPPLKSILPPSPKNFTVLPKKAQSSLPLKDAEPGSNAWAMSGKLTQSGKPLLASDPHLDLRIPNLWYRIGLHTSNHQVFGVSIPGVPGVVIGRNEEVAWAFTNSAIDNSDQILISKTDPALETRKELILIKNEEPQEVRFTDSPWGPVISEEGTRGGVAVQWTALDPENLKDLDLSLLNSAQNTQDLLNAFHLWAGPPQNAVFVTQSGDIGWTLAGRVPNRKGFDGTSQIRRTKEMKWAGYVPAKEIPVVLNPREGFLVSANQRTVPPLEPYKKFGHDWPNAARAKRIHDLLSAAKKWNAADFLTVQTDTMSLTHLWYRDQLLQCPEHNDTLKANEPLRTAYSLIHDWDGNISLESSAYPILKQFRFSLFKNIIQPIAKTISEKREAILFSRLSNDFLLSQILRTKKQNFLPPPFKTYCELLTHVFRETIDDLGFSAKDLPALKWGDLNQSHIQHPFSRILPPFLQPILNFSKKPMPGDYLVPNVMTPSNGASMRLVIDLANPQNSLFSQPGGQSGSVFSPHYSDIYPEWISGRAVPFEAQPGPNSHLEIFFPG